MRFWERWENATLKSSLATWLTPAGAHHVCQGTSLGHTPPQLRLPRATFGPCFQQPVRPAARNVTQKPQVPQVRTPLEAKLRARPSCSASHAIVLVRADRVQSVNAAWPVAGHDEPGPAQLRWPTGSHGTLSPRPSAMDLETVQGSQVTAPEQPRPSGTLPEPGARPAPETGLGHILPSSSPGSDRRRRAEGTRRAPPPYAPRPRSPCRGRGHGWSGAPALPRQPLSARAAAARAAGQPQEPVPGLVGTARHGTARKGAAGRGSGHRRQAAARHFLTPPNFIGRRRRRTQPPPR